MNDNDSNMAANAICHAATMAGETVQMAAAAYEAPSVLFRPKLFIAGNQWCALYGEDLQSGVVGFGDSPTKAMYDFDKNWRKPLNGGC